jgi:erythromycin esterase-like protein
MLNAATQSISNISHPWGDMTSLNDLLYDIGDAQFVLLGEASHGTHDYYLWRARISQK